MVLPRDPDQDRVEVHPDDLVPGGGQDRADPAGAAPGIEDPRAARQHGLDQREPAVLFGHALGSGSMAKTAVRTSRMIWSSSWTAAPTARCASALVTRAAALWIVRPSPKSRRITVCWRSPA